MSGDQQTPSRPRVIRRTLGLTGTALALLFACLALTPSLLPRPWALQGVACGLTAATGYAVGATVGGIARLCWRRPPPVPALVVWRVLAVAGPVALGVFLWLGARWQQTLRQRLDMEPVRVHHILGIVGVGVATFGVLLLLARVVRLFTRFLTRLLGRWIPRPIAVAAGCLVVAYASVGIVQNFLLDGTVNAISQAASLTNGETAPGVTRPLSGLRSGGTNSFVAWDALGKQGRSFIGTAPTRQQISAFTGAPAVDPIRVYVGLDSAATAHERAQLALQELDRTKAFTRAVLGIVIATGTGWVDENVTDALEYMHGGNTALVSMQYSYLPSWLSFVVDQEKVRQTTKELVTAVHDRWSALPEQTRPKLVVFGESLGAYGIESAYGSLDALAAGTDGALLVGPPFANPIWGDLVRHRDPGTPVWDPVYRDGSVVRFADEAEDLRTPLAPVRPKVVYLQNSSDPVVWFSPELLIRPPAWLKGPRGPDVPARMRWYPGITFWQTTLDLAFANEVPPGHGHLYGSGVADGWAALVPPDGWTAADTARLRTLLDSIVRPE
ncbi:alpha/beta-hydrolase family protein [Hamadaea sp.]|uniref:alpha/beta hydrolase n=1 Tax=Hamadaea sp. TaxID=2024425 RepID=UPI0025C166E6|nr:alpha/beta-hydrolase family protein [Hamadaea sp.]